MALNTLTDYGLSWLVVLAGACLLTMIVLVLLISVIRLPGVSKLVNHTLLRLPSLNGRLSMAFFMVGIIPALLLPPLLAVTAVNTIQTDRIAQIAGSATAIGGVLNPLVNKLASGVATLADNISTTGQLDEAALDGWLLRYHKQNPEFVSTWVATPDGQVVTATGSANGEIGPWEGPQAGVAIMDTFSPSMDKRGLYVSTVKKGVAPRFDPMMVISAPIFSAEGVIFGVVQGQLNLRQLYDDFIDQTSVSGVHTLIIDEKNQVLLSSQDIGLSQFENLSGHALLTQLSAAGDVTSYGFKGTMQQFGDAKNFAVAQRQLDNGWRVFVIASQAGIEKQGLAYFGLLVIWAVIALLLARSLSRIHSSNVAESLKQLQQSLHIFDEEGTISLIPSAPKYAPTEVKQVYNRVRESMRKSRDAYRDLRRTATAGDEKRSTVEDPVSQRKKRQLAVEKPDANQPVAIDDDAPKSYQGRIDSVTQLAGIEVFEEFFGEAWVMGSAESRPISLVLLSACPNKQFAAGKSAQLEESVIKVVATSARGKITHTLDLVARIDAGKFGIVLPDTNLEGALAVAHRIQQSVQVAIGDEYLANSGVVTIVPNAEGNARSFINLAHRALQAAEEQGGEVTFFNAEGKIMLLEEHGIPESPEDALTIRSGTVSVKSIDEAPEEKTEVKAEIKANKSAPDSSAPRKKEDEQPETAEKAGGTHVLEWDGGY